MFLLEATALVLIAFGAGVISAIIGVGGGFLVVPILVLVFGLSSHQAVGTSLVMIIFTALSSTLAYAWQRRIDYKTGLALTLGTVPGAIIGAYVTKFITAKGLASLFGVFLIIVAIRMIMKSGKEEETSKDPAMRTHRWHRKLVDSKGVSFEYTANIRVGVALSFLGGFASGFFGVGGGAIMVPVMALGVGIPMHVSVATSMFIMIFTSISGTAIHLALRHILFEYAACLIIGIIGGTQLGAIVARKLEARTLKMVFGI
ncbi:MAG: sulfite exporter TauE/SafE family protein, partial [Candidatus Bathyarchaeia archaeon]